MTDADLRLLRRRLLRFFLDDGAQQTGDLLRLPEMQSYNRRWLRKLVYSLAWAGLLDQFGTTSGTFFHTNRYGFILLASLDEDLRHQSRRQPSLDVH